MGPGPVQSRAGALGKIHEEGEGPQATGGAAGAEGAGTGGGGQPAGGSSRQEAIEKLGRGFRAAMDARGEGRCGCEGGRGGGSLAHLPGSG